MRRVAAAVLVIGEKGKLYAPGDYGEQELQSARRREPAGGEMRSSRPAISRNGSAPSRAASRPCRTSPTTPARLTETILLGNLAVWVAAAGKGEKVEWDAKNLKSHQHRRPGADHQADLSRRLYAGRLIP